MIEGYDLIEGYSSDLIEGIQRTCAGNISSDLIDFNCVGNSVPEGIKRCYPQSKNNYDCDNKDNICNNEGECVPTLEGGYCRIDDEVIKIYDGDDFDFIGKKKKGEEINEIQRALIRYKNLYSQKCNPFATKIDEKDLDKEIDSGPGDYGSRDEFSDIDGILVGGRSGNYFNTIFLIIFLISLLLLVIYYRKNIISSFKNLKIEFVKFMIKFQAKK
jgi:hypothetical protein